MASAHVGPAAGSGASLPPRVAREVARELRSLQQSPLNGIRVTVHDDSIATVHAEIDGPDGTPYDGGVFRLKLLLPRDFPNAAPKGFFTTRIFHPNVARSGEVCVNVLKKDWKASLGLKHVLLVVRCLLIEPYPESALNEEAGKLLLEDYGAYARHARLFTSIHALPPAASSTRTSPSGKATAESSKNPPSPARTRTSLAGKAQQQSQQWQEQDQHRLDKDLDKGRPSAQPQTVKPPQGPAICPAEVALGSVPQLPNGAASPGEPSLAATSDSCKSMAAPANSSSVLAAGGDVAEAGGTSKNPTGSFPAVSAFESTQKPTGNSPAVSQSPLATNRSLANADSKKQTKGGNGSLSDLTEPAPSSAVGAAMKKAKGKGENTSRSGADKKVDLRKKSLRRL